MQAVELAEALCASTLDRHATAADVANQSDHPHVRIFCGRLGTIILLIKKIKTIKNVTNMWSSRRAKVVKNTSMP